MKYKKKVKYFSEKNEKNFRVASCEPNKSPITYHQSKIKNHSGFPPSQTFYRGSLFDSI